MYTDNENSKNPGQYVERISMLFFALTTSLIYVFREETILNRIMISKNFWITLKEEKMDIQLWKLQIS